MGYMSQRTRVVLITGGTKGIGIATLARFAREAVRVAFCARGERLGKEIENQMLQEGREVMFFPLDIVSEEDVAQMIAEVQHRWGGIDVLINNAGVLGPMARIEEYPPLQWKRVIETNVIGTFLVTRLVLPLMRESNRGRIIFLTSSLGRRGRQNWGAYSASKFAIEGLTETLAEETQGSGIWVMALNPEKTRTSMRSAAYPLEDSTALKGPSSVADVLYYLATSASPQVHGRSLNFSDVVLMENEGNRR